MPPTEGASYRIVDHVERFVAPHSITFNCSADKLYCGHRDAFEVFDLHRPGEGDRVHTISSRKSKDGMKGIISSMAFSPDYSGLFAAGSFSSALWLFAEGQGSDPVCQISGSSTSVSQVKFNPMQPQILYASFRMETHILAWDTRNATIPVAKYVRSGNVTNQRLWFDIDPSGRWLASGSDTGTVGFYDVSSSAETGQPMYTFAAHGDVVGSVAFHPSHPTVLTVSGSRHFEEEAYISEDDGSHPQHLRAKPVATEAMMKIWNI
ncbi:WD40-repeat-containing domain protein [Auriculariales sp. MPI-PUGE-AT-0066]|nr:WD40-repeat-containing domain protein [Auriculariales sp. MPI-PUGE-AT-0066]